MKDISKAVTYEGADVEAAINKALSDLKVSRDQIKVKVVCEESKGLFGMGGSKPAKIKVTVQAKNVRDLM